MAPARRAEFNPMAMACFRLVTFGPVGLPLFRVPALNSFIASPTEWRGIS